MLAVVVLVCSLFALLLGAILVSNKLQSWLKVRHANGLFELVPADAASSEQICNMRLLRQSTAVALPCSALLARM